MDSKQKFMFTPLQSDKGKELLQRIGKDKDDISSVVLIKSLNVNNREVYYKSDAVLQVVMELGIAGSLSAKLLSNIIPLTSRDIVYDGVANNRYKLMGQRECRCSDPNYSDRFL